MSDALGLACMDLGSELFEIVQRMDSARWREEVRPAMRRRLEQLAVRTREIRARYERYAEREDSKELIHSLEHMRSVVEVTLRDFREGNHRPDWAAVRSRLTTAYDRYSQTMRARSLRLPRNRPTNYMRNVYHVGSALMLIGLIQFVLTPWVMIWMALGFAAAGWILELVRWLAPASNKYISAPWKAFIHPDEHWRINSATWLVSALLFLALSFDPLVCTIAVAVLGFADPAAALIGRRFGRTRLHGNRTLEGSTAFVVVGTAAGLAVIAAFAPELALWRGACVALCAALPAAIAELYSTRLDDNLTVPVCAGIGAWAGSLLLLG